RQLPLLGVKYLDLYRRTKVDDAVFELLTKEYEIAKIQEAKDNPTAQVLDPALVPDKKSSPHRLIITLAGMLAAFLCSCGYIIGCLLWQYTDDSDRGKQLLKDVFSTMKLHADKVPFFVNLCSRITCKLGLRRLANGSA